MTDEEMDMYDFVESYERQGLEPDFDKFYEEMN